MMSPAEAGRMSSLELRASLSLASLFALRMLGLFLILPVFAVHAPQLSGGDSRTLIGVALGIYGLPQGILQIPSGMVSDRYGRKRVIVIGLLVFSLGSFVAAWASDIHMVILGRAIQGAGAISAPDTAFIADITREEHRTKAMAMVGGSIGLAFAVSLVAAPALYRTIGMDGIFNLIGALSLVAIWVTLAVVPPEPQSADDPMRGAQRGALAEVLRNTEQLRLNFGMAIALLLAFFVAFNILEASLPSLVSRVARPASRGTALGVYNTTQALGLFVGGAAGGWLAKNFGDPAVFVFGFTVIALWLGVASRMRVPGDAVERAYRVRAGLDPVALREKLVRVRGVREAVVVPEEGIARLTVYPESFDEQAVTEIIGGES